MDGWIEWILNGFGFRAFVIRAFGIRAPTVIIVALTENWAYSYDLKDELDYPCRITEVLTSSPNITSRGCS